MPRKSKKAIATAARLAVARAMKIKRAAMSKTAAKKKKKGTSTKKTIRRPCESKEGMALYFKKDESRPRHRCLSTICSRSKNPNLQFERPKSGICPRIRDVFTGETIRNERALFRS